MARLGLVRPCQCGSIHGFDGCFLDEIAHLKAELVIARDIIDSAIHAHDSKEASPETIVQFLKRAAEKGGGPG